MKKIIIITLVILSLIVSIQRASAYTYEIPTIYLGKINAELLNMQESTYYINNTGGLINGNLTINGQLISTVTTGIPPFVITSTTVNTNLNADLLDGHHSDYFEQALTFNYPLTRSGNTINLSYNTNNLKLTNNQLNTIQNIATDSSPTFMDLTLNGFLISTVPTGNAPIYVSSLTVCDNLNADLLDGKHASNLISDETFGSSWNGVTDVAPSKNAIYKALTDGTTADIYVKSLKTANKIYSASDMIFNTGSDVWKITTTGNLLPVTDGGVNIGSTTYRVNEVTAKALTVYNSSAEGTYIQLFKGAIPGYPNFNVPAIKTDYQYMYFVANSYAAYIQGIGNGGNVMARSESSEGEGNYIGLLKGKGSLPGYPNDYYPTLKTDFNTLYFSVDGSFTGYHTRTGWYITSSKELKENFKTPEEIDVLGKIKQLDIKQYNFKGDNTSLIHIGPMAESFNTVMNTGLTSDVNESPNNIGMISINDIAGTALAGVQELIKKVEALEARVAEQELIIKDLTERVNKLEMK